jgi:5-hydroxyisourate hydrolase-like protein (transthyretin family)
MNSVVLDTQTGRPAAKMAVTLSRMDETGSSFSSMANGYSLQLI